MSESKSALEMCLCVSNICKAKFFIACVVGGMMPHKPIPSPQDVQVLILKSEISEFVTLHDKKGLSRYDYIKNFEIRRLSCLSKWTQYNHKGPFAMKKSKESQGFEGTMQLALKMEKGH